MTIYVYCNETGLQVASYSAETNEECEAWVSETYGINDYSASYCNQPISNA